MWCCEGALARLWEGRGAGSEQSRAGRWDCGQECEVSPRPERSAVGRGAGSGHRAPPAHAHRRPRWSRTAAFESRGPTGDGRTDGRADRATGPGAVLLPGPVPASPAARTRTPVPAPSREASAALGPPAGPRGRGSGRLPELRAESRGGTRDAPARPSPRRQQRRLPGVARSPRPAPVPSRPDRRRRGRVRPWGSGLGRNAARSFPRVRPRGRAGLRLPGRPGGARPPR